MLYRKARLGWSTGPSSFWVAEYNKAVAGGEEAAAAISIAPDGSLWYARQHETELLLSEITTRDVYDFGTLGTSTVLEGVNNTATPRVDIAASNSSVYATVAEGSSDNWLIKRSATDLSNTWIRLAASINPDGRQKIALDGSGNTYSINGGGSTIDLVALTSTGTKDWDEDFFNASYASSNPCVFADSSNLYALVDNTNNGTREEVHIVKIDPATPTIAWQQLAHLSSGTFDYSENMIYADGSGNVYAALTLTSDDVFLVQWNSSGTHQYTKRITSGNTARVGGMASDGSDNLYFLVSDLTDDVCQLIKFNSSGTIVWQKRISGPAGATTFIGNRVAIDSDLVYCQVQDIASGALVNDYVICLSVDDEEDYGTAVDCNVDGTTVFSVSGTGLTVAAGTLSFGGGGTTVTTDTTTTTSASGWVTTDRGLL